jgi:hypothetical protein
MRPQIVVVSFQRETRFRQRSNDPAEIADRFSFG